ASGMEARQGGDSFAGSVHDSPPRQGDARKKHSQENNKTDRNESSRKKKNSSRNNNISNRQMTGMKRQKHTTEHPRNERGGAPARPLSYFCLRMSGVASEGLFILFLNEAE
ncbi:hypothetical protein OM205_23950, partial [Escherichia albertii]|nr:hypothetical protein [Escherichia albertii]